MHSMLVVDQNNEFFRFIKLLSFALPRHLLLVGGILIFFLSDVFANAVEV